MRKNRANGENDIAWLRGQPSSHRICRQGAPDDRRGAEMATGAKARNRLLSFPTAARCRPAITPSLNSSRRCDGATDVDSLGRAGCMYDAMRGPDLWPAALEQGVGAFLDDGGSVGNYFTIINGPDTTAPSLLTATRPMPRPCA